MWQEAVQQHQWLPSPMPACLTHQGCCGPGSVQMAGSEIRWGPGACCRCLHLLAARQPHMSCAAGAGGQQESQLTASSSPRRAAPEDCGRPSRSPAAQVASQASWCLYLPSIGAACAPAHYPMHPEPAGPARPHLQVSSCAAVQLSMHLLNAICRLRWPTLALPKLAADLQPAPDFNGLAVLISAIWCACRQSEAGSDMSEGRVPYPARQSMNGDLPRGRCGPLHA